MAKLAEVPAFRFRLRHLRLSPFLVGGLILPMRGTGGRHSAGRSMRPLLRQDPRDLGTGSSASRGDAEHERLPRPPPTSLDCSRIRRPGGVLSPGVLEQARRPPDPARSPCAMGWFTYPATDELPSAFTAAGTGPPTAATARSPGDDPSTRRAHRHRPDGAPPGRPGAVRFGVYAAHGSEGTWSASLSPLCRTSPDPPRGSPCPAGGRVVARPLRARRHASRGTGFGSSRWQPPDGDVRFDQIFHTVAVAPGGASRGAGVRPRSRTHPGPHTVCRPPDDARRSHDHDDANRGTA